MKLLCLALTAFVLFQASSRVYRFLWVRHAGAPASTRIDLAAEPLQSTLPSALLREVTRGGESFRYRLHSAYEIQGRVVSVAAYPLFYSVPSLDVDVALVWGRPKEALEKLLGQLTIFQAARWAFWQSSAAMSPTELQFLREHFSNNHLIAKEGSSSVREALGSIRSGDELRIKGYLADIASPAGRTVAQSSTVRGDSGDGACEIVWVEEIQLHNRVFR